jgi:GDP-4-dehydro-6-deoxy-D-mannose reductase
MTSLPKQSPVAILITGASGFVGRHLIGQLLNAQDAAGDATLRPSHLIAATYQQPNLFEPPGAAALAGWNPVIEDSRVTVVSLDVRDADATLALVAKYRPEQIYHLAARASGADAERDGVFEVNVAGTRNVLAAAAAMSPPPRVLLAGTGYVYGNIDPEHPAREEDPIGPLWRYGAYTDSKIEMEAVAQGYRGMALVARAFGHTGPGQTPTFAIPNFARQLARIEAGLEPAELSVGNLTALRDMLDVRDVVRAYRLLMTHGAPGDVVNVALGQPRAMSAILEMMVSRCTVPVTVRVDLNRLRPADIACSCGDPSRLHRLSGWTPNHLLSETLDATLNYWRELVKVQ